MSHNLLQIQEPNVTPIVKPSFNALFELGFRPLYICGCVWALISIFIWVFFPTLPNGPLFGFMWHSHEMLWGYIATIAVGFLLTASNNWTGINPLKGKMLAALCCFWLMARIGFLVGTVSGFWLAFVCEIVFFTFAFIALIRVVLKTKNYHNLGLPPAVLGLAIADGLFLYATYQGNSEDLLHFFNIGILCMTTIALLIARRIVPFFSMRAIAGLNIPRQTTSGHIQLTICVLAIVLLLLQLTTLSAIALAIAALITLYQLFSWRPLAVRKVALLWVLYTGYFCIGLGLLSFSLHLLVVQHIEQYPILENFSWLLRAAWPVHLIAAGGFSVLIIGMVTRTSLGHLGRPLKTNRKMVISFYLIILAALLRIASLSSENFALIFLHSAALCWIIGFGLFLWQFIPMLIRPRPDQGKKLMGGIQRIKDKG